MYKKEKKRNLTYFLLIFWAFVLLVFIIFLKTRIDLNKQIDSDKTVTIKTEALKAEKQLEITSKKLKKLKRLLRADYDSYAHELGLTSGLDACMHYNKEVKDTCLMIYSEVK